MKISISLAAAAILLSGQTAFAATLQFVERATTDTVSVHAGKAADNIGDTPDLHE